MRASSLGTVPDANELIKLGLHQAIYKICKTAQSHDFYQASTFCDNVSAYRYLFQNADWKLAIPGFLHQLTEDIDYSPRPFTNKVLKTLESIAADLSESVLNTLISSICETYIGQRTSGKFEVFKLQNLSIRDLEKMSIHFQAIAALGDHIPQTSAAKVAVIIAEIFNLTNGISLNESNRDRIKCYLALQKKIINLKSKFSKVIPAVTFDKYVNQYKLFKHISFPNRHKIFSNPTVSSNAKCVAEPVAKKSAEILSTLHILLSPNPKDYEYRIPAHKLLDERENYEKFILAECAQSKNGDETKASSLIKNNA